MCTVCDITTYDSSHLHLSVKLYCYKYTMALYLNVYTMNGILPYVGELEQQERLHNEDLKEKEKKISKLSSHTVQ